MTQTAFRTALLDPAAAVPPGLTDAAGRPAGKRFAVYRNNVAVGLTEALGTAFPVVRALVGEAFFAAMAGVFLRAHPPRSPVLMLWGEELPVFLEGFPPLAGLPWIGDVARLELALRQSYHAADAPPADLSALPPDRLPACRLTLAPSLRVVRSRWPVIGLWRAGAGLASTPPPGPEDAVVLRPGFDPAPHRLPAGGADFLAALSEGRTVADAATRAGAAHDLAATLALLISGGAITGWTETPA